MPTVSIFPGLPSSPPLAAMIGIVADKPVRHSSGTRIAFSADAPSHRTTPGVKSPFIHLGGGKRFSLIRKMTLGFVIFLVICVAVYLHFHHPKESLGTAYAGDRGLTLYNSSAQIRSPVGTVDYGEPLQIEARFGDQVQVRTSSGLVGWADGDDLISGDLWQQEKDLNAKTAVATPEATGSTAVISNLHIEPGRNPLPATALALPMDPRKRIGGSSAPNSATKALFPVGCLGALSTLTCPHRFPIMRRHPTCESLRGFR